MKQWFVAGAAAVVLLTALEAGAEAVYVKVAKAQIRDGKDAGSPLVAEVDQGAQLTVLAKEGLRYQVQLADGRKGYVSRLSVSEDKPKGGGGLGGIKGIEDDRSVTERGTAASGRGLSEAAQQMAKKTGIDPAAVGSVKEMEKLAAGIKPSAVAKFRKEGGMGK